MPANYVLNVIEELNTQFFDKNKILYFQACHIDWSFFILYNRYCVDVLLLF